MVSIRRIPHDYGLRTAAAPCLLSVGPRDAAATLPRLGGPPGGPAHRHHETPHLSFTFSHELAAVFLDDLFRASPP